MYVPLVVSVVSDKKLRDLLLNNNKFNYLAGAAVMLSKMQNAKKQVNGN